MSEPSTLIVGIGNLLRGDDAIGQRVAQAIRREGWPDVSVVTTKGENLDLYSVWKGYERVFVIDAMDRCTPGGDPVAFFAAREEPLPAAFEKTSTHGMGPGEAIELARALGELPASLTVVGIAAKDFGFGESLTDESQALIPTVVARIRRHLQGDRHA